MKCSICDDEIGVKGTWTQGNNAQPMNNGRCCDGCNEGIVVPARVLMAMGNSKEKAVQKVNDTLALANRIGR